MANSSGTSLLKQKRAACNQEPTMTLHDDQKLDNNLGRGPDHHLPLPSLLSIVHGFKRIIENTDSHHADLTCKITK
jgi:hypothetical protein